MTTPENTARLDVTIETLEEGRRAFRTYGVAGLPPGALLRRVEVRVAGDLLASIPFYDPAEDFAEEDPDDYCQAMNTARGDGVEYQCTRAPDHHGAHSALNGGLRW